jgi:hypothetical protein
VINTRKLSQNKILNLRKEIFLSELDFDYSYVLHRISEQHRYEGPNSPLTVLLLLLE